MPVQSVDGIPINYVAAGGGTRTLCLVHGSGGSALSWIRQLEGLAEAAHTVALDLPGHGDSGGDGRRKIDDYRLAVWNFLESLGLGRVVLGGHSMGGAVALAFALSHPDRLAGLILVGTGARLRVLPRIFELLESSYPEGCALVVDDMGFARATPQGLRDGARAVMLGTRPQVTIGDFRACDVFDIMDRVEEIRVPTLVICGREDRLTPPKYSRFFANRIPRSRLVVLEETGHYVQLEQPDRVNAEIKSFLATLP